MKIFRIFTAFVIVVCVAATIYSFLAAEGFEKKMNLTEQAANAQFLAWAEQNKCIENPLPCAAYSKIISDWKIQLKQYKEAKNQSSKFQVYNNIHNFLRQTDEQYLSFAQQNGRTSLIVLAVLGLLLALLISGIFSGKKNTTKSAIPFSLNFPKTLPPVIAKTETKTKPTITQPPNHDVIKGLDALLEEDEPQVQEPAPPKSPTPTPQPQSTAPTPQPAKAAVTPAPAVTIKPQEKPKEEPPHQADEELLLAIDSLKNAENPQQAIEHLELALTGNISENLRLQALLLSGSLRIKNKIDELKGREQLSKVLEAAPEGSVAEKAKRVLLSLN